MSKPRSIVERARELTDLASREATLENVFVIEGPAAADAIHLAQAVLDFSEALELCAEYYDSHCRAVQENADCLLSFHHTVGKARAVLAKWKVKL